MWELAAEGPYKEVAYKDIPELPHGTPVKFRFDTIWQGATLLDVWDSSVRRDLEDKGFTLTSAGATAHNKYEIEGVAQSPGVFIILFAVLAILGLVAYVISKVSMWIDRGDTSVDTLLTALTTNLKVVVIGGAVVVAGLIALRGLSE